METSQPPLLSTDPPPPTAVDPSLGDLAATLTSSEPLPSPSAPTPAAPSPPLPSLTLPPLSNSSIASPSPSQPQDLLQQSQQRQPVACRTRSHTQPGQSPLTPSTSSSSSSSSSSSAPSAQRSGMAIGVPAIHSHHTRPSLPSGYSYGSSPSFSPTFTSSSSFSQTLGSFPRSLASMAEQSTGSSSASPSFSQSFSGMPRSSAMMEQQQPNSNAQFKPPVPGVQTIGMIGSLSGPSRIRASGIQHQQRLCQTIDRSMSQPATNQTLNSQKFSSSMLSRPASMPSPNAPLSAPQTAQSLQQQWMSNQGKQALGTSFPSPYRPHMKQSISQQNPQTPQQQQHSPPETTNQLQVSSSGQHQQHEQQHQQQNKLLQLQQQQHHHQQQQNKYIPNNLQELHTFRNQQSQPQQPQQAVRAHGSINQRPNNPLGQPVVIHSGSNLPITADTTEMCTQIVTKRSIQELVAQIDPFEKLDPEVEDVLVEIADDFVESITTAACSLAKHRRSNALEAKDILLHVERNWNMTLPGFGGDEIKCYKKPFISDIHRERLAMIRKSVGISSDAGSTRNVASGQIVANSKAHAGKASAPTPGSPKGS